MGRQHGVPGSGSSDRRDAHAAVDVSGEPDSDAAARLIKADARTDDRGKAPRPGASNILSFPGAETVESGSVRGHADPEPDEYAAEISDHDFATPAREASNAMALAVAEHPITRALSPLSDPANPLNPARIIADTLDPVRALGGWSERVGTEARHPHPEEVPEAELDDFWELWLSHHDQMRNQCIRLMSGNIADAEDALSNAMLRASQKFPSYADEIVNKKAWLGRLVYNVCMDHYRQKSHTEYGVTEQDIDTQNNEPLFTERQQSPEEHTLSREMLHELSRAIEALSDKLSKPLLLRCVDGWSYPDIAEELDLRADTVRKRVQLARDRLRDRKGLTDRF